VNTDIFLDRFQLEKEEMLNNLHCWLKSNAFDGTLKHLINKASICKKKFHKKIQKKFFISKTCYCIYTDWYFAKFISQLQQQTAIELLKCLLKTWTLKVDYKSYRSYKKYVYRNCFLLRQQLSFQISFMISKFPNTCETSWLFCLKLDINWKK
jgi:hypothetical protein